MHLQGRRRCLGVDPGSQITGYGLLEWEGLQVTYLGSGTIQLPVNLGFVERLERLFFAFSRLLEEAKPDVVAFEAGFSGTHVLSGLRLAQVRGALVGAALQAKHAWAEYSPRAVKQAVTGKGQADKEQVGFMVAQRLGLAQRSRPDESDALAVALTHWQYEGLPTPPRARVRRVKAARGWDRLGRDRWEATSAKAN